MEVPEAPEDWDGYDYSQIMLFFDPDHVLPHLRKKPTRCQIIWQKIQSWWRKIFPEKPFRLREVPDTVTEIREQEAEAAAERQRVYQRWRQEAAEKRRREKEERERERRLQGILEDSEEHTDTDESAEYEEIPEEIDENPDPDHVSLSQIFFREK